MSEIDPRAAADKRIAIYDAAIATYAAAYTGRYSALALTRAVDAAFATADALSIQPAKLKAEPVAFAQWLHRLYQGSAPTENQMLVDFAHRLIEDAAISGGDMRPCVVDQTKLAQAIASALYASPVPEQAGVGVKGLEGEANRHLGNVLVLLADLHPDDYCKALAKAMAFYNTNNPDTKIVPSPGYVTRLVYTGPIDALIPASPTEPAPTSPDEVGTRVVLIDREDGGLSVQSPDLPGLILSGADPARVASAIPAAIKALRGYSPVPSSPPASGERDVNGLDQLEQMAITEHLLMLADIDTEDTDRPPCDELCGHRTCDQIGCVVDKYRRTHGIAAAPNARDGR